MLMKFKFCKFKYKSKSQVHISQESGGINDSLRVDGEATLGEIPARPDGGDEAERDLSEEGPLVGREGGGEGAGAGEVVAPGAGNFRRKFRGNSRIRFLVFLKISSWKIFPILS